MKYANFSRARMRFIKYVHLFPKITHYYCLYSKKIVPLHRFSIKYSTMQMDSNILTADTRLVIFDLDGTLYKKNGMVRKMLCAAPLDCIKMLAERKTRHQLRGVWLQDETTFYQTYFQTMATYCSHSAEQLQHWYFNRYMPLMVKVIGRYYKPVEWFANFVSECRRREVKLVILSDYGHTHEKLHALGIDEQQFDWVISAPELGGLKPAAPLITKVAERFSVSPNQCLVIGDREDTDGELARAGGAMFCLVQ